MSRQFKHEKELDKSIDAAVDFIKELPPDLSYEDFCLKMGSKMIHDDKFKESQKPLIELCNKAKREI